MSTCISRYGEYGEHVPGEDKYTCSRCCAEDTEAMLVDIAKLTEELATAKTQADAYRSFLSSLTSIAKSVTTALVTYGIVTEEEIRVAICAGAEVGDKQ